MLINIIKIKLKEKKMSNIEILQEMLDLCEFDERDKKAIKAGIKAIKVLIEMKRKEKDNER
jgi:hypothetical protein